MNKCFKGRVEWVFAIITIFFLLCLFVVRLTRGVETSDEAYYVTIGLRMIKGNVPFGDMWELNSAGAYITLPFLFIRSLVSNDTDGVHLYLRICMLFLNSLGLLSIFVYCKKDIEKPHSFLMGLMIVLFAPFQIYNFSYNNLSILFVTISMCMFLSGLEHKNIRYAYISGAAMALAVMVYPTMIICCFIIAILIFVLNDKKKRKKFFYMYAIGGISIAIPILAHLSVTVGLKNVYNNLHVILSVGSTSGMSLSKIIMQVIYAVAYLRFPFVKNGIFFCIYWIALFICAIFDRLKMVGKYLLIFYPLICCVYANSHDAQSVMNFVFSFALIAPITVLISADKKKMLRKCALEWGISMIVYFIIAISSSGGVGNARAGLIIPSIASIRLIILVLSEKEEIKNAKPCIYFLIVTFLASEIFLFYGGIYRDRPYKELTEKIDSGVYKGIYTTAERKRHILDLEDVMHQVEDKGESVLILYHSCFAYLMVDMIPKTPSTWGCINSELYGFDNQELFLEYLSHKENIPDNILIVDVPHKYDYGGHNTSEYQPFYTKINDYVQEKYLFVGAYEKGESGKVEKYEIKTERN